MRPSAGTGKGFLPALSAASLSAFSEWVLM
jgi:hypothetical protein